MCERQMCHCRTDPIDNLGAFFELWEVNYTVDDERQVWARMAEAGLAGWLHRSLEQE